MTTQLAFRWPGTRPARNVSGTCSGSTITARIRQERSADQDVLWRLTTQPWARARRAADGLRPRPWSDRVELIVTALTMGGMVLATLACAVA